MCAYSHLVTKGDLIASDTAIWKYSVMVPGQIDISAQGHGESLILCSKKIVNDLICILKLSLEQLKSTLEVIC